MARISSNISIGSEDVVATLCLTGEAHESALSGLPPQTVHVFVVDVDQVDGLQPKGFSGDNHLLPGVQQLCGVFGARGACVRGKEKNLHYWGGSKY